MPGTFLALLNICVHSFLISFVPNISISSCYVWAIALCFTVAKAMPLADSVVYLLLSTELKPPQTACIQQQENGVIIH
jgi:hypothetical protein